MNHRLHVASAALLLICGEIALVACGDDGATPEAAATATPARVTQVVTPTPSIDPKLDASTTLAGQYFPPHPGEDGVPGNDDDIWHVAPNATMPICTADELARQAINSCYHSNPPTSGPHAGSAAPWGLQAVPATKEALVHNMEHGGVVIWYNTEDAAVLSQLRSVLNSARGQGRLVVLSKYDGMEPDTIALTSWTRLDKFGANEPQLATRVQRFINDQERRFNPEGF